MKPADIFAGPGMKKKSEKVRINTLRELDALVGEYITGEVPEIYWEDAHAVFRFETEAEAMEAMKNLRSQPQLPKVDWESIKIKEVKSYKTYSADIANAWVVVEKISSPANYLHLRREKGLWLVSFGNHNETVARSAPVAICIAALRAMVFDVDCDPDRLH